MVELGEVHTGLLQHSSVLSAGQAVRLLSLREGESVAHSERPNRYTASPEALTGVDCQLPSRSGRQVRGVGTVVTRTLISGGRILQGSSRVDVEPGSGRHRRTWPYYLARPGRVEAVGSFDPDDLRAGFVTGETNPLVLDIGSVSGRAMDTVQRDASLDRRAPIRAPRTSLRWTATSTGRSGGGVRATFTVLTATVRSLELVVDDVDRAGVMALCEDLALHDWLLTTMSELLHIAMSGSGPATERAIRLRPVIEHLMHLWMPGARVPDALLPVWADIEKRPGFTRQWRSSVDWIRDQVAIGSMVLLQAASKEAGQRPSSA